VRGQKLIDHPGERGTASLPGPPKVITTQQAPRNIIPSLLLLRLMDGILSTYYCHVFNYF